MVLTPKQSEAMEAVASEKYSFILYGGAIRGGKSVWALSAALVLCSVFPNSRWCVIRENMEKIRTTTIPSFKKIEPSGVLKQSPYEYTHPNGSVILFKSENYASDKDLDWMKGFEANGFIFEEINECQQKTLNKAIERAGSWIIPHTDIQPHPIILATCNPTFGWVKTLVYDRWKDDILPTNWLYVPAKITDNIDAITGKSNLPQAYLDNLKTLPQFEYLVFVEGNWDIQIKTGGEFYKCFELSKNVAPTKYDPSLPLHISFDDNAVPYLPVGIFQIVSKELIMIDEIAGVSPENTVSKVCSIFSRRYQAHTSGLFVYGDATARKQDTKMEKGHNFYTLILDNLKQFRPIDCTTRSNPSVAMRGNFINTIFENGFNGISIVIGEKCLKTITDLVSVKEAEDKTKNKATKTDPITNVSYQEFGHFSDLLDYIICVAFKNDFDKYRGTGQSNISAIAGAF